MISLQEDKWYAQSLVIHDDGIEDWQQIEIHRVQKKW